MVQDGSTGVRNCRLRTLQERWAAFLVCAALSVIAVGLPGGAFPQGQQATPADAEVDARPSFEVVSIKPSKPYDRSHSWNGSMDSLTIENYTLRRLIRSAYNLKSDSQVLGGPKWIGQEAFDIKAKFGDADIARLRNLSGQERYRKARLALQSLLADQFQLKISRDTRSIPVYALVVAKSGAKVTLSPPELDSSGNPKAERNHSLNDNNGHMTAKGISMSGLADWLTLMPECDRVVLDRSGLTSEYDFKLDWTEDQGNGVPQDAPYPGLFTALREQLGLELKADKGPVDVVIVEAASEPVVD